MPRFTSAESLRGGEYVTSTSQLFVCDRVRLARIATERDAATNLLQQVGGLLHTRPGHVRVGVARAEKNWRAGQISYEFDRCSGWSYEPSREGQQRCISARVPADKLRCKEAPSLSATG
ncbi:MAG: hypothetical protein QOE55_3731 [Acidobacteriaceae bacterium]|nr:hypothetical protein [Acidobacteriaceae bacterium]